MRAEQQIIRLLQDLIEGQALTTETARAMARGAILEGATTGNQTASSLQVQAQSANAEIITTIIAYTGGAATTTLTLGIMKLPLPQGITLLTGLSIPVPPAAERSLVSTSSVLLALWMMGYEAPVLRFSSQ